MCALFGGFMQKDTKVQTTNLSEHILTDNSMGAGDNGVVLGGGSTFNYESNVSNDNAEIALGSINRQAEVAGMALGTAVNAQTLASGAIATIGAANWLQAGMAERNADAWENIFEVGSDAVTGAASDAMFLSDRSLGRALMFGESALIAAENANRAALNFSAEALLDSVRVADRAVDSAEFSLESSLSFAKSSQAGTQNFLDDVLSGVFGLVKSVANDAREESAATRDFAGAFVGDFYESQKSGDVQTLQMIAKYGAAVAFAGFAFWALRKS
jgi:hypothetical protein